MSSENFPFTIYMFLFTLCRVSVPYFSKHSDQQMTPMQITAFSYLLLFSLNFLIYCVAGRQFRTGLRQMLRLNSTPSLNEVCLWNGILNSPFSFMIARGLQLQWVWTKLLDNMRAIVLWMFQFILFEVKTFTSKTLEFP